MCVQWFNWIERNGMNWKRYDMNWLWQAIWVNENSSLIQSVVSLEIVRYFWHGCYDSLSRCVYFYIFHMIREKVEFKWWNVELSSDFKNNRNFYYCDRTFIAYSTQTYWGTKMIVKKVSVLQYKRRFWSTNFKSSLVLHKPEWNTVTQVVYMFLN